MICNECNSLAIDPKLSDYPWCLSDGENILDIYQICRIRLEINKKEDGSK